MSRIRFLLLAALCTAQSLYATNYYVATSGNDGADGTSDATPFKTLSKAAGVVNPGDSVLVADGTYDGVTLNRAGNASGWIVFKSINKHGATITNSGGGYAGFAVYSQYIEINGFEVTNPAGHGISVENASHVRVLNCHSHHNGNSGISGAWGDFYHFEGNICHHNASLSWYSGISIYQATDIGDSSPGYHTIIRNNISYSNLTDPDNGPHTDGNGIIIDDWNHTQATGEAPFTYPALVENNLCFNNGGGGVKIVWSDNITVRHNTCYNNSQDLYDLGTYRGEFYVQQSRNCVFYNNIGWADPSVNSNNAGMMDKAGPSNNTVTNIWDNNIFWDGSGLSVSTGDGSSPTLTNNLGVDPGLAAPGLTGTADFHLEAASPAVDAGTDSYGYPADDLDGNTRPADVTVDIGCYEYYIDTVTYLRFASASYQADEDDDTVTITVYRTGDRSGVVTVDYAASDGTAAAGQDYTAASGTLTFNAGETGKSFTVAITDDGNEEDDETVTLTLSNPGGGALLGSPAAAALTIRDNDYDLSSPLSVWSNSDTPGTPADGDDAAVEVGLRFRSAVAGHVSAVRFYKGTGNTGTHVGNLWSTAGNNLGTVTFAGETASGWQEQAFSSPVAIEANTEYVISYFAPNGHYAADAGAFSSGSISNGPVEAVNSVYKYGSSSVFPDETYGNTNYWVDVVFNASQTGVGNDITAPGRMQTVSAPAVLYHMNGSRALNGQAAAGLYLSYDPATGVIRKVLSVR